MSRYVCVLLGSAYESPLHMRERTEGKLTACCVMHRCLSGCLPISSFLRNRTYDGPADIPCSRYLVFLSYVILLGPGVRKEKGVCA